jgi:hypothetical protein
VVSGFVLNEVESIHNSGATKTIVMRISAA